MTRQLSAAILVMTAVFAANPAAQTAKPGHPLIPPYPGSTIGMDPVARAFEEFDLPAGPTKDGQIHEDG